MTLVNIKPANITPANIKTSVSNEPEQRDLQEPTVDLVALDEAIEYIRPAIQADGGDLFVDSVSGGEVAIRLVGACQGCPLSMMTLRAGIERILTERVPGVESVTAS